MRGLFSRAGETVKPLGGGWDEALKPLFDDGRYKKIREFLIYEYSHYIVYPDMYDLYNCFRFTPLDKLKVVILGQDPYHEPGQAHGLCFSVKPGVPLPPSLKNIYKEIESDLGIREPNCGDLTKWANEGVLLLNTTLTVREHRANSHANCGWAWFTDSVTNKGNKIQAGSLKIGAYAYDLDMDGTGESFTVADVNGGNAFTFEAEPQNLRTDGTAIINDTDWEPGKSNAKLLKVVNEGTLAAEIKLNFETSGELVGALWFDFVKVENGAVTGNFEKRPMNTLGAVAQALELPIINKGDTIQFILVYGMYEEAGNEYMEDSFTADVTILAKQYTYEEDGFGSSDYDENAVYPVSNFDEFKDAMQTAQPGDIINLTANISADENISVAEGVILDGMGNTIISKARIYANKGAEMRNITFRQPTNSGRNASFIYAENLSNELIIENCTFVDTQWDAIQVTPTAGANIEIKNNIFRTTENIDSVNKGKCERYIHVQAVKENIGADFSVTITGNTFENIEQTTVNIERMTKNLENSSIDINDITENANKNTMLLINCLIKNINDIVVGFKNTLSTRFGGMKVMFGKPMS